jgi:hypothetical protein
MPNLATVIPFPQLLANVPECAQCKTKMTLRSVHPHPRKCCRELATYVCGDCGLIDEVENVSRVDPACEP